MTERQVELTVFGRRLPPEVEARVDRAYETFRENHRDPANLALHGVGYYAILKGVARLLRRRPVRGLFLVGVGVAMLLAGHEIEGTPAFASFRSNGQKA